jgi:signal transduction histidine kinase
MTASAALAFFTAMRLGSICDLKVQTLEYAVPDPAAPGLYRLAVGPGASPPVHTKFGVTGQVLLSVIDTGPGFDEVLLPQLFTAYRRFDDRERSHTAHDGGGQGLVRKQADLLGNALHVRSVPERGSAFTLRFARA